MRLHNQLPSSLACRPAPHVVYTSATPTLDSYPAITGYPRTGGIPSSTRSTVPFLSDLHTSCYLFARVTCGCLIHIRRNGERSAHSLSVLESIPYLSCVVSLVYVRLRNVVACYKFPGTTQCIRRAHTQPACLIPSTRATYLEACAAVALSRQCLARDHHCKQCRYVAVELEGSLPPSLHAPSSTLACDLPARHCALASYPPTRLPAVPCRCDPHYKKMFCVK